MLKDKSIIEFPSLPLNRAHATYLEISILLLAVLMVFSFVSCDDNANEEPKPEEKTEYTLEVPGYVLASEESFKATIKGSDGTEKEVEINTPETKGYVEVSSGDLKATVLVVDKVYDKNTTEPPVFGADEYILLDNVEYSNIPGIVIEAENVHVYGNNACLKIENAPNNFVLLTLKNKVFIDGISFDVSLESGTGTIIEAQENSSGFEVTNCSFKGNYKDGDDRTLRAFLCGSGYDATGWKIENCTFDSVRQPMYVETAGSILNNTIKNTRGWVICDNIKGLVFKGNSFEGWNAEDVAIIEEGGEAEDDRIFTNDACIELSKNNNNCRIDQQPANFRIQNGEVVPRHAAEIGDAKYDTLTKAIEVATSGDTIVLVRDATGKGIGSKDGSKARENLTIDFNNHTYTMLNPAVGSKGTETQAMHWGTTLGKITMKNGTFKVDSDATEVKMAMQNYIDFDAVNMIFDFTSIPVVHYGDNEFTGTEYESYNGKEVPLFNNNSGKMLLDSCTVKMPAESNKGISVEGDGVTLKDCKIEGYLNLPSAGIELTVQGSTTITGKVVDYFTDEVIEPTTEGENTIYKK